MGRPRSRANVVTWLEAPSPGPDIDTAPAEWIHETDAVSQKRCPQVYRMDWQPHASSAPARRLPLSGSPPL